MVAPVTFTSTKSIFLIGFEKTFDLMVDQLENEFGTTDFFEFAAQTDFDKWCQLNSHVYDKKELPIAILLNYDFLLKNNFKVLQKITESPRLKFVPIICIDNGENKFKAKDGLRRGIDDCYSGYIEWGGLRKRVSFLNTYKPFMTEEQKEGKESKGFKMPYWKRAFDIIFSLGVLIILSPLLILVGVLIKLESKGPFIYKSKRAGTGFQIFDFLKFRSMADGADKKIQELAHLNKYNGNDSDGSSFVKLKKDPRVTRFGKIIRKLSIDELPQMLNVLKGEMSVVGNRPLPLYEADQLTNDQWATRFLAPAGITGWWQINKQVAKKLPESERMRLDIEYAENFSIWFDLKIILKTIPAMIQKDES
jgi:lipopolysaccharide/colanic/teichoic acid biosynthesis glycosyltransferase